MVARLRLLRWLGLLCSMLAFMGTGSAQQRTGGLLGFSSGNCILNYISEPIRIQRFDICKGEPLPDFNLSKLPDPRGAKHLVAFPEDGLLFPTVRVVARSGGDGPLVRVYDKRG